MRNGQKNMNSWCRFIQQFNWQQDGSFVANAYPLLNLQLLVNQAPQKKKRQSVSDPEDSILSYEPSLAKITAILLEPLTQICESSEQFIIMEKDLVPLVYVEKKSVFLSQSEDQLFQECRLIIEQNIEQGFREPRRILEKFGEYSFLFERTQKSIYRGLFGDQKESIVIDNVQRERVEAELGEYMVARRAIERLSVGQRNCGFFMVRTATAKDALLSRCNELVRLILLKVSEICVDNVKRIQNTYEQMYADIRQFPKNEKELVVLKRVIGAHEDNIARNERSVRAVDNFLELLQE